MTLRLKRPLIVRGHGLRGHSHPVSATAVMHSLYPSTVRVEARIIIN